MTNPPRPYGLLWHSIRMLVALYVVFYGVKLMPEGPHRRAIAWRLRSFDEERDELDGMLCDLYGVKHHKEPK